jgi:hypothetical protein
MDRGFELGDFFGESCRKAREPLAITPWRSINAITGIKGRSTRS